MTEVFFLNKIVWLVPHIRPARSTDGSTLSGKTCPDREPTSRARPIFQAIRKVSPFLHQNMLKLYYKSLLIKKNMTNEQISKILYEMAELCRMEGEEFKARAYEKVSRLVDGMTNPIEDLYEEGGIEKLEELDGVGKNIAEHLSDLLESGTFEEYKNLKKKIPVNIFELLEVEGVGPKNIKALWEQLGIRNVTELEKAVKEHKIRELENFGEKTENKILEGIQFLKQASGRKVLGAILPKIKELQNQISKFSEIEKIEVAGSVRRKKETIGDIDFVVIAKNPQQALEKISSLAEIDHVIASGEKKLSVALKLGLNCDFRFFEKREFGSAMNYMTGSQAHNVKLRRVAKDKGMKLSEYGLFEGESRVGGKTEDEIYKKLGLHYIEPELREDRGEVEASQEDKLPNLIKYDDLKGDLQIQTNWTDGQHSILEMAEYAMQKGLEYIAITDHTKDLSVTNGNDEKKLMEQMKEIDKLNENFKKEGKKFRILKGAEVNILKDGSLDIDDEMLSKLDVVGAAIHKNFELSREEQTQRVIRAMNNPNVDIIFHLTTRVIGKRKAIEIDVEKVIEVAKETGTIIEIDAFFDRLDISEQYVRMCLQKGVKMSIDSDAHAQKHIDFLEYGIAQARRGWAQKNDIINSYPAQDMLSLLKGGKR